MNRMDSQFMLRCSSEDREKLRTLSDRLRISQSSLARVAFAEGLKIVVAHGIRVDDDLSHESRAG